MRGKHEFLSRLRAMRIDIVARGLAHAHQLVLSRVQAERGASPSAAASR